MNLSIFLTEKAIQHFSKLTQNNKVISLGVTKSGCSGFKYSLKMVETLEFRKFQGIPFVILPQDEPFLNNVVIDFKQEGLNSQIVYDNPNTMNECGCGESFSLKGV